MTLFRSIMMAFVLALGALAGTASAQVVPMTLEEMYAISDTVAAVRVEETRTEPYEGLIITKARVRSVEVLKGRLGAETELALLGGDYKQLSMRVPSLPMLDKGEEVLLFLSNPSEKLPRAARQKLDASSPLIASPQIVGGWQGKLSIVRSEAEKEMQITGSAPIPESAKVTRRGPRAGNVALAGAPAYSEVRGALQRLETRQKAAEKDAKTSTRRIPGVPGEYRIAERTDDPVLRRFDPLPSMAYLSEEELAELQRQAAANGGLPAPDPGEEEKP